MGKISFAIVCVSNNDYVQIWLPDKEKWRSFHNPCTYSSGQPGLRARLRFSSDSKTLFAVGAAVSGSSDYPHAWGVATRRRKLAFSRTNNLIFDVSPDARWAAASYGDAPYLINLQKPTTRVR